MIIPATLGAMALNSVQAGSTKLSLPRWVSDQGQDGHSDKVGTKTG